jgi:hypothetical protein
MPDGTTAPESRVFSTTEALSSMGKVETPSLLDRVADPDLKRRMEFGQRRVADIKKFAKTEDAREVFKRNFESHRKDTSIEPENVRKISEAFGGDNKKEAKVMTAQYADVLSYSSVRTELRRNGGDLAKALDVANIKDKGGKNAETIYKEMRERSLNAVLTDDVIKASFGDALDGFKNDDDRRAFLEQTVFSQPDLAQKIARKMGEIDEKKDKLPPLNKDPRIDAAEKAWEASQTRIDDATNRIKSLAESSGLLNKSDGTPLDASIPADAAEIAVREKWLKTNIDKDMELGDQYGTDLFLTRMRGQLIEGNPNAKIVEDGRTALALIEDAQKARDEAIKNSSPDLPALEATLKQYVDAKDAYVKLQGDAVKFKEADYKLARINALTSVAKDKDGKYTGSMAQELGTITKSNQEATKAEQDIAIYKKESTAVDAAAEAERDRQESKLIKEMQDVMASSFGELLNEQYIAMSEADKARIEKEGTDTAKTIADKLDKNWSKFDPDKRKYEADRTKISNDVDLYLKNGENAFKQFIMRDLDIRPLGPDGNPIAATTTEWSKDGFMDRLNEDQKQQLESAFEKYKADYQKKLITNFFLARGGVRDKAVSVLGFDFAPGDLSLTKGEWKRLSDLTGGVENLSEIFKSAKEASPAEIMKKMQESGINLDSPKAKILFAILAALGMAVTGAVAAPLVGAVGAGALASGVGAIGMGTASTASFN